MVTGYIASASPLTSDTDPEDEGVNLSDPAPMMWR